MKEAYFTPENISRKSSEYLSQLNVRPKFNLTPKKSALIVTDMQEFFINENSHAFIPSSKAIIPNIQSLINRYYEKNLPVIFTRHVNTTENAELMGEWWTDLLTSDNPLSRIADYIDVKNSSVIQKEQYDAFYNTNLEKLLTSNKVTDIVITGVMTHLCCETTTRSAFVRGFRPFFVIDGTATYNESFHVSSLLNLSHGFAVPVLSCYVLEKTYENF